MGKAEQPAQSVAEWRQRWRENRNDIWPARRPPAPLLNTGVVDGLTDAVDLAGRVGAAVVEHETGAPVDALTESGSFWFGRDSPRAMNVWSADGRPPLKELHRSERRVIRRDYKAKTRQLLHELPHAIWADGTRMLHRQSRKDGKELP